MKIVVFSGPSIERAAVEAVAGAEWRPPVAQGDVYRAARAGANVIAIIDGYFEGLPSVWHKEILWALSQGIAVFGASSMGALRAAELHVFGMQGVGEIFRRYRDGIYEDDDEVAVLHAPADMAYRALSLPMVNARATIDAAVAAGRLEARLAGELAAIAKSIFYQQRDWRGVLKQAQAAGLDAVQLEGFANWLPGCERDLKREDAEALLERLAAIADSGREAPECGFEFEWTLMWDRVYRGQAGYAVPLDGEADRDLERAILDELRLEPARYRELARALQLKRTALREADRERLAVDIGEVRAELGRLRNARELYSRAALDDWMTDNDWSEGQLRAALEGQLLSRHAAAGVDDSGLLDEARLSGDYPDLKKAALRKRAALAATGSGADPVPAELLAWYFGAVLGEPIPGDLDAWLATIDLDSREDFYRILRAHYACRLASDAEKQ